MILWREESAISDISAEQLQEDYYMGEDDDGCFPESEVEEILKDKDTYPNGMDDLEKVYDKGTPILFENF